MSKKSAKGKQFNKNEVLIIQVKNDQDLNVSLGSKNIKEGGAFVYIKEKFKSVWDIRDYKDHSGVKTFLRCCNDNS